MKAANPKRTIPEEIFERVIQFVDGPMNRQAERLLKNKILLALTGAGLTLTARSIIAARDLDPLALLRGPKK
jgi:hypothetical protein